jgi:hypothetical protein
MEKNTQKTTPAQSNTAPARPNETGSISVEGFVKIFDPNTKQTFVEKRA